MRSNYSIIYFIFLLLMACGHSHESEMITEEDPEPYVYTLYSDSIELFVEYNPLIAGEITKFATHVTVMSSNFYPLVKGRVSVRFVSGSSSIESSLDSTTSPGLYRLELKPDEALKGTLIFDVFSGNLHDTFSIDGVQVYANKAEAMKNSRPAEEPEITFTKEQAWRTEFSTIKIQESPFKGVIKCSGQLSPARGDSRMVTSPADGIVLFGSTGIVVGSGVSEGQTVFRISAGAMTGENVDIAYREAKADYDKAKSDFDRLSELVKDKIVSEKEFLQASVAWEKARARMIAFSGKHSEQGLSVNSPVSGFVSNLFVREGQYVKAGEALAGISGNKKLILQANVSPKHFDKLQDVVSANFIVANRNEIFNIASLNGRLLSYGKSSYSGTSSIPISFEFENSKNLIPGSVAEVYLQLATSENSLSVPVSSLVEEQGLFYVFVQTGGESFEKREVQKGVSDGMNVRVLSGIEPGVRVVHKGVYKIKLSQAAGAMPEHGHEH